MLTDEERAAIARRQRKEIQTSGLIGTTVSDYLRTGRQAVAALHWAVLSGDKKESGDAAQGLLEIGLQSASLIELSSLLHWEAFYEASKFYPFFPILLASNSGRDTKQKLSRVNSLPISANRPFKRLSGRARNDDLRSWIESTWDQFQFIRKRASEAGLPGFTAIIRELPELRKSTARQWSEMMVRYHLEGPGGSEFPSVMRINVSRETRRRIRRKENRLKRAYGGTQLYAQPTGGHGKADTSRGAGGTAFFVVAANPGKKVELDAIEATKFSRWKKRIGTTAQTPADVVSAFSDAVEKRLRSILRH
jgi:hypothetical protein